MRRVWATVVSVWVTLAIVAGLAWTRHPAPRALLQAAPVTLLVTGKNGKPQRVLVTGSTALVGTTGTAAPHATTQTSPPPVG